MALPTSQRDIRGIALGDRELELIAERFPELDYLYLDPKSKVSDEGLSYLSKSVKLHQVVIENGERVSDQGIAGLALILSLKELIVSCSGLITDSSLEALSRRNDMQIIYLFESPGLSSAGKTKLKQSLPGCEVLFENRPLPTSNAQSASSATDRP